MGFYQDNAKQIGKLKTKKWRTALKNVSVEFKDTFNRNTRRLKMQR